MFWLICLRYNLEGYPTLLVGENRGWFEMNNDVLYKQSLASVPAWFVVFLLAIWKLETRESSLVVASCGKWKSMQTTDPAGGGTDYLCRIKYEYTNKWDEIFSLQVGLPGVMPASFSLRHCLPFRIIVLHSLPVFNNQGLLGAI